MEDIINKSLNTARSYEEYKSLVLELIKEGKSTGPVQNESRVNYTKLNNQRIPIGDNSVIEEGLGKLGICCAADLVNEIVTVGPNFKAANNFLWPMKLSNPKGGFSRKTKMLHFMEGGEAGARGEEINALVKKMI